MAAQGSLLSSIFYLVLLGTSVSGIHGVSHCEFKSDVALVKWRYMPANNTVKFMVDVSMTTGWFAVGISETDNKANSDLIRIDLNPIDPTVHDSYIGETGMNPTNDANNNVMMYEVRKDTNSTHITFIRELDSNDTAGDVTLTANRYIFSIWNDQGGNLTQMYTKMFQSNIMYNVTACPVGIKETTMPVTPPGTCAPRASSGGISLSLMKLPEHCGQKKSGKLGACVNIYCKDCKKKACATEACCDAGFPQGFQIIQRMMCKMMMKFAGFSKIFSFGQKIECVPMDVNDPQVIENMANL